MDKLPISFVHAALPVATCRKTSCFRFPPFATLLNRYVLVYFLKGSLPWQGLKARNAKRKYNMILERKQAISIQQLCQVWRVRSLLGLPTSVRVKHPLSSLPPHGVVLSVRCFLLLQGLPQQFAEYLAYCRSLKFDAKPNIPYLQVSCQLYFWK